MIAMLRPWVGKLYVRVLIGIFVGLLLGLLAPNIAVTLQPLADGFIKLIKMLLAPIIFGTVVLGMAKMGNITEVGRIGVRALIYFEALSTIALVIGLVVVNVVQPGVGMNIDPTRIDAGAISSYTKAAESHGSTVQFFILTTYRFRPEVVDGGRLGMVEARSWTERVLGWVGSSMRPGASAGCWASGCRGNARRNGRTSRFWLRPC